MMKNPISVNNKVFIITGVSSGIGKYLANSISEQGAIVYGISRKRLKNTKFINLNCDVNNQTKLRSIIKKIYLKEKKIDVLINNAGVTFEKKSLSENMNYFDKTISTNTKSPILTSLECFKYMSKKNNGSIINICSLSSKLGFPMNPAYVASKAALAQSGKALALDFGRKNIRVNNILPGYIKTKMTLKSRKSKKRFNERKKRTILNRWGDSSDLLGAVLFLSSDSSSYITGADIPVDGGWLAKGI
mgnify:CR=1 FL=1